MRKTTLAQRGTLNHSAFHYGSTSNIVNMWTGFNRFLNYSCDEFNTDCQID